MLLACDLPGGRMKTAKSASGSGWLLVG